MKVTDADVGRFLTTHDADVQARFKTDERTYKAVKPQLKLRQIYIAKLEPKPADAPKPADKPADVPKPDDKNPADDKKLPADAKSDAKADAKKPADAPKPDAKKPAK